MALRVFRVVLLIGEYGIGGLCNDAIGHAVVRTWVLRATAVGVITTFAPKARSSCIFSWLILSGITKTAL